MEPVAVRPKKTANTVASIAAKLKGPESWRSDADANMPLVVDGLLAETSRVFFSDAICKKLHSIAGELRAHASSLLSNQGPPGGSDAVRPTGFFTFSQSILISGAALT